MPGKETTLTIHAPVHRVYNICSQFQEFPKFMTHVKDINVKGPTKAHWTVELVGRTLDFDTEITELKENDYIEWHSVSGIKNSGFIKMEEVPEGTRLTIHFNYMPEEYPKELADKLSPDTIKMIEDQIEEDINSLKTRIEKMAHAA